jgi:hypothetical protein
VDNLQDKFKEYWIANVGEDVPFELVYSYIKFVSESLWYKQQKKIRKRFYFCVPRTFMSDWLKTVDVEAELKVILDMLETEVDEPKVDSSEDSGVFGNGLLQIID